MFALAVGSVPPDDGTRANEDKEIKYATIFPMPPFLGLKTTGRRSDLNYVFEDKSQVSQQWLTTELQAYFEQLFLIIQYKIMLFLLLNFHSFNMHFYQK